MLHCSLLLFRMLILIGPKLSLVKLESLDQSTWSGYTLPSTVLYDSLSQTSWSHYQRVLGGWWIPIVLYICYLALTDPPSWIMLLRPSPPLSAIKLLVFGVLFWTLLEYCLHRFVFHLDPPPTSRAWITFHFIVHGQHHKISWKISNLPCSESFREKIFMDLSEVGFCRKKSFIDCSAS